MEPLGKPCSKINGWVNLSITMVMTLASSNITANRWYPQLGKKSPYPTPQSILRGAYNAEAYKFIAEGPDVDYIRAAVILPLDVPFSHLLNEPWVLSFRGPEWRMLIASTDDPIRWIDLARASGCIAYQRGHTKTFTYKWEMHPMDKFNCKLRPNNALGVTKSTTKKIVKQQKPYDRDALVDDIRAGLMTQTDIGKKHGLSRIRVMAIAHEEGIRQRKPHHGTSKL
jgi:hypothetical protein